MAIDHTDPIYLTPGAGGAQPELMLSAVLHLMSHYTASEESACVKLASVIERHLKALSTLPGMAPVLAATCQQLSEQWATIVERSLPPVKEKEEGFLSRIMGRARPTPQVV
ncbi:hypothetical protein [Massilia sp. YMA4]|uniref:Uncharacterized protein n=1 Tax=[Empedobacter] haloabium TaxID=592317 RepID=A0ABZ1UGS4_9BURK|nr:hypothetical protein [Massilia sp. YMA4]AXA89737.1 hypothetical protein DPH57_00215 [Massilia sp. YMA4]